MSYFVSLPKVKENVVFFRTVTLGPANYIAPNLTVLTVDLVWLKYLFSYLLHKNIDFNNREQVNEMILNPEDGAYSNVLKWSFEYASRNIEPPAGVLIATRWNYGAKAMEKNRDFFSFQGFGRFVKDLLDTAEPSKLLAEVTKLSEREYS